MTPSRCRAYLRDLQTFGIKLGLATMRTVLASFGDPHRAYPSVHVAGTNGKGSVCAMLAEILAGRGLRVGLYTSPHLVRVEERIRVGGRTIPPRDFRRLAGAVKARIDKLRASGELAAPPTFFEVLTLIAFLHFRDAGVDVAVIEVGMGGRFDATNVVRPLASVITSVSRDHQEHLGRTLAGIAFEKAGIVKRGVPVVCGAESRAAVRVVRARAAKLGAPFTDVFGPGRRLDALPAPKGGGRPAFRYGADGRALRLSPALLGGHQGRNAAVAAAAALVLGKAWRPIPAAAIERGVARARWAGRLEPVGRRPLVLLDGAHNEAGAAALRAYLDGSAPRPLVLVFTMMRDKAIGRVAGLLFPVADRIVVTTIAYPRDAAPAEILRRARAHRDKIAIEPSLRKAVALARAAAGPTGAVVVTGSLFLVGEFKRLKLA